jgi:nitroreductase
MELREAIGRRRSSRFLRPYRPVEPEKIQRMLEAARLASHWGNVGSIRAVVVFRDGASPEALSAITAPIAGYQIRLAPVVIVWYLDTAAVDHQGQRLRELLDAGAMGVGEGKREALETRILPIFDSIRDKLKEPGLGEIDGGQAIAQATLVAFEQGLGTCCLASPSLDRIRAALGMPETCRILLLQTVGYPAESPEAGGQRPRRPFEELFHLNRYGSPFPRSAEVVEELKREGMLQDPAPAPWREKELEWLRGALGIQDHGLL